MGATSTSAHLVWGALRRVACTQDSAGGGAHAPHGGGGVGAEPRVFLRLNLTVILKSE